MTITYTEEKKFTPQQVADLFLSVRWVVGKYPDRLHKALINSSRVISAWDGDRLVSLIRVMDASMFHKLCTGSSRLSGAWHCRSFAGNGERGLQVLLVH